MVPFLPPEILLLIIRLSLPPFNYPSFRERNQTLLAFSLVSRTWRDLAQGELFDSVVLEDEEEAFRLSVAPEGRGVVHASKIKSLCLSGGLEVFSGPQLMAEMKALSRLHLDDFEIADFGTLPTPAAKPLIVLEHLSLSDPISYLDRDWLRLIRPSVLPALVSLALGESEGGRIYRPRPEILKAIESVASQLLTLAIVDDSPIHELEEAVTPYLKSFTALKHLVILGRPHSGPNDFNDGRPDIYSLLPAALHSVEIIVHPVTPQDPHDSLLHLLEALRSNTPSLRELLRMSLPPPPTVGEDWSGVLHTLGSVTTAESTRVQLKALAAARNITLDETGRAAAAVWFPAWMAFHPDLDDRLSE